MSEELLPDEPTREEPIDLSDLSDVSDRERELLLIIKQNICHAEMNLWTAGDIMIILKREYPQWTTQKVIDKLHLKWKRNRMDEITKTARVFPQPSRSPDLTFTDHIVARKSAERAAIGVKLATGEEQAPKYEVALEVVKENKADGKEKTRDVTRSLMKLESEAREPERRKKADALAEQQKELLGKMYFGSCVDLMKQVTPGTLAIANLDPPYGNYEKTEDGKLFGSSASNQECDNNDREAAIEHTKAALKAAVPLLRENGVILLWQNARMLPLEIAQEIHDLGLTDHPFIIWDKKRSVLGNPAAGVMYSTEICYVLTREGENALGFDVEGREQVIRTGDLDGSGKHIQLHKAHNLEPLHQMQKPEAVNADLLRRFSQTGDMVLDAFGCSASFCIAAEQMGRRWMYSESNEENYKQGVRNMENHLIEAERLRNLPTLTVTLTADERGLMEQVIMTIDDYLDDGVAITISLDGDQLTFKQDHPQTVKAIELCEEYAEKNKGDENTETTVKGLVERLKGEEPTAAV